MKVTNARIVNTLKVAEMSGSNGFLRYTAKWEDMNNIAWIDMKELNSMVRAKFQCARCLPAFEAQIVAYDMPESRYSKGLSRKQAQATLRNLNLSPLSTNQTFQLAVIAICEGTIMKVCREHGNRRLAVTVPINPEFPEYYYFGEGNEGLGSFRKREYECEGGGKNLYFWFRDEESGKLYIRDGLRNYHFPLLVGVRSV